MLNVTQATFAVACSWGFSDVHEFSGGLQIAPSPPDKQTAGLIHHQLTDEFGHGFSCFVWYVEVNMAPMDAIWLVLVKM